MFHRQMLQDAAVEALRQMTDAERSRARRPRKYHLSWSPTVPGTSRVRSYFQVAGDHDFWIFGFRHVGPTQYAHLIDLYVNKRPLTDRETYLHALVGMGGGADSFMILPVAERVPAGGFVEGYLSAVGLAVDIQLVAEGLALSRS